MRTRKALTRALLAASAVLIAVFSLFPFYWAINTSLTPPGALFDIAYWPARPTVEAYRAVFAAQPFGRNILNSVLVAGSTVAASLALALLAAFALGRVRLRGRGPVLYVLLGISMFPQVAVLSGLFELVRALGLYNRWPGLGLAYMIFTLPFTVWVLSTFMARIPRDIEDAALLDGAGTLTLIFRVLLPPLAPALVTTGLIAFVAAWNEFLFALTLTLTDRARTAPVAIALISGASQYELPWGQIAAASVIVTAPLVALAVAFERRIVSGLTGGAING